MKETITDKILGILQSQAEATVNLLDIFTSSYHDSFRKMRRTLKYGVPEFKTDKDSKHHQEQIFYSMLNRLKNQGLIDKKINDKKRTIWEITKKGLEKLKIAKRKQTFFKRSINYKKESDGKIKIVIFDIPEKERHKRTWLRTILVSLGFSMLQKSVWVGKNKIPEEFLYDLKDLKMLSCVQIFEISQKGTIAQIS